MLLRDCAGYTYARPERTLLKCILNTVGKLYIYCFENSKSFPKFCCVGNDTCNKTITNCITIVRICTVRCTLLYFSGYNKTGRHYCYVYNNISMRITQLLQVSYVTSLYMCVVCIDNGDLLFGYICMCVCVCVLCRVWLGLY
jgi:hypothetical protein